MKTLLRRDPRSLWSSISPVVLALRLPGIAMLRFALIRFTAALAAAILLPAAAGAAPTRKPNRPHAARSAKRGQKRGATPPLLPPAQVRARDMPQLRCREER